VSWEAPVKVSRDMTEVCATLNPAAIERTPNETAYTHVATARERAFRRIGPGAIVA
jgi:hypothetical protein